MSTLNGFDNKDFIEQVSILGDISEHNRYEYIDELLSLFETISLNDAVGYMVKNTLVALLSGKPDEIIKGLSSDNNELKKMCVELAGEQKIVSAVPVLINLMDQVQGNESILDILLALSKIQPKESLPIYLEYMHHKDPFVSSLAIDMIGNYGDAASIGYLYEIIDAAESDVNYERCNLQTANSIKALGQLKNNDSISFLVSKIHHKNPTARSIIQQELIKIGNDSLPFIAPIFEQDDVDKKILSANLLGRIGSKEAGEILVRTLDKGLANNANIKFAVYEALGNIPTMTSIVCLADSLSEKEDMILLAIISSLNNCANEWIINKIKEMISTDDDHGRSLIKAVISSSATKIFKELYCKDNAIAQRLIDFISRSNDEEIMLEFCNELENIEVDRAKSDIRLLRRPLVPKTQARLLAVDDSESMLHFYKSITSEIGLAITTALNGKEALDILEKEGAFDVIITDMNMPIMDGIEFTSQARTRPSMADIPIIMITTESKKEQGSLAKKAGADDFINKPFTPEQLQDKIKKYIK